MDRVNPEGEVIAWRWPKDVEGTFPRIHMLATMNTERTVLSRLSSGVPILRLLPVVTCLEGSQQSHVSHSGVALGSEQGL